MSKRENRAAGRQFMELFRCTFEDFTKVGPSEILLEIGKRIAATGAVIESAGRPGAPDAALQRVALMLELWVVGFIEVRDGVISKQSTFVRV